MENRYKLERVDRIYGGILFTFYDLEQPIGSIVLRDDNHDLQECVAKFIEDCNGKRKGKQ